jgi:hypothetical protein
VGVIDLITTDGETDTARLRFGRTVGDNDSGISCFAARRYGVNGDEAEGVGAGGGRNAGGWKALGEASKFFASTGFPERPFGGSKKLMVFCEDASVNVDCSVC